MMQDAAAKISLSSLVASWEVKRGTGAGGRGRAGIADMACGRYGSWSSADAASVGFPS